MFSIIADKQEIKVIDKEKPVIKPAYLLIKTLHSAISPGTEASLIEVSKDRQVSLGYSAVGKVEECGEGVDNFKVGDVVAVYGAPYVEHSEYLLVPITLCAKVPANVDPKEAALGGIGAIAIHALRVPKIEFGETIVVVGLGLLGQMIAKIADAAACDVLAYDLSEERTKMLEDETGIRSFTKREDLETAIEELTGGNGVDAVLLCPGGKRSPLTGQSLEWVRKQGKVVIVGDIEPDFPRNLMFAKEAQIMISRAGGPGRYDVIYEKQAIDYPFGYVRWTEGRNVAEYLRLVSRGKINVKAFITDEVEFKNVAKAYDELLNKDSSTLTKIINFN